MPTIEYKYEIGAKVQYEGETAVVAGYEIKHQSGSGALPTLYELDFQDGSANEWIPESELTPLPAARDWEAARAKITEWKSNGISHFCKKYADSCVGPLIANIGTPCKHCLPLDDSPKTLEAVARWLETQGKESKNVG